MKRRKKREPSRRKGLSEQAVLELFATTPRPYLSLRSVLSALGLSRAHRQALKELLERLVDQGKLRYVGRNRYAVVRQDRMVEGKLHRHPAGFAFVLRRDGPDLFVPPPLVGRAQHGDWVLAEITRERPGRNPEGRVVRILKAGPRRFVGTLRRQNRRWGVVPDDPVHGDFLPLASVSLKTFRNRLQEDFKVLFRLRKGHAEVLEIFGHEDDPSIDTDVVIARFGLPEVFSKRVERFLAEVPRKPGKRKDRRNVFVWTIDPYTARDFDDAISVERREDGFVLGVHIADVSHYVRKDTPLDQEALKRGLSVYLLDRVVPMLPEILSNDLCSLRPAEDRPAFSVWITFDREGRPVRAAFERTLIHSRARLTYEDAQRILDGGDPVDDVSVVASPAHTLPELRKRMAWASELARLLHEQRARRGSLDFDLPETYIEVLAEGTVLAVRPRERLWTHRIIEEFMIAANEAVGRFLAQRKIPTLFRVHEPPDPAKLENFFRIARTVLPEEAASRDLQRILRAVEGKPQEPLLNYLLLRSMKRAGYVPEPQGHFGLASPAYLHFTSPIRRYPDLVVHRTLLAALQGKPAPYPPETLAEMALHVNEQEQRADEAERELLILKKMEFMKQHVGKVFEGLVTHIADFGFFVELVDFLVEGLVPVETLEGRWRLDPDRYELVGPEIIRIGDLVTVEVMEVQKWRKRMTLRFVGKKEVALR